MKQWGNLKLHNLKYNLARKTTHENINVHGKLYLEINVHGKLYLEESLVKEAFMKKK